MSKKHDHDIAVLGNEAARKGNRLTVHLLTAWGWASEPVAKWGRVLWKGGSK